MQLVCKILLIHSMYYNVCVYVCVAFEYDICIQRRSKRKGDFRDAPGGLAKQISITIAASRSVAGNFPWSMTASNFSPWWGFFAFVFVAFLIFFCLAHPTP